MLIGVSVTWYTWLEQGRDIQTSTDVLERLARALTLSPDEREYLFELVQHRPPPLTAGWHEDVDPAIGRLVETLAVPCLVTNVRWDVVALNDLATRVFRNFAALPCEERNILKFLFSEPNYQKDLDEFERLAHRWLSKVRLDYGRAGGDPAFEELIKELGERSEVFRRVWADPCAVSRNEGVNRFANALVGELCLEHTSYLIEGSSTLRLIIFVPADAESAARLTKLREMHRFPDDAASSTSPDSK